MMNCTMYSFQVAFDPQAGVLVRNLRNLVRPSFKSAACNQFNCHTNLPLVIKFLFAEIG
jgi:hypothetical protein